MKKLLLYLYIILPMTFFGIPVLVAYNFEPITFHYYKSIQPDFLSLISVLLYYLIFGILIFSSAKNLNSDFGSKNSIFGNALIISIAISFMLPVSYSRIILLPLLIIHISKYKLNNLTKLILFSVGLIILLFQGQRFFLIFVLIILFKERLTKLNIRQLLFTTIAAIIALVFILEPLKRGLLISQYNYNLIGLIQHLQPIYVSNFMGFEIDFSSKQFLIESIPFLKSIFKEEGSVEVLGNLILPRELILNEARVGSTSSIFFQPYTFIFACFIVVLYFKLVRLLNYKVLSVSVVTYLVLFGPYFIRRSFTSYLIDLIILLILLLPFKLFQDVKKNRHLRQCYKS